MLTVQVQVQTNQNKEMMNLKVVKIQ